MATVPLFAVVALGAGTESAGWALAVFAAANAAALTFSGRLADSLGRKPMMVTGLLVTGSATAAIGFRSEEHTSELQSLMRISYAVFCLKKKKTTAQPIIM